MYILIKKNLKYIKIAFLLLIFYFFSVQYSNFDFQLLNSVKVIDLILSLLLLGLGTSCFAYYWSLLLNNENNKFKIFEGVICYFQGQLGKYLPGSVWSIAGRIGLAVEKGIEFKKASKITTLHLIHLWGNCLIIGAIFYFKNSFFVAACLSALFFYSTHSKTPYFLYFIGWISIGFSYVIISSNILKVETFDIIFSSLFSWLGGFLFIPSPSGIGIREYLFAYFLNNESLFYDAILVASLSRILTVINDFGLTAILSIMNKIKN